LNTKKINMDLLQLLQSQIGGDVLKQLSGQVGANEEQTGAAVNGAFSALLNGLSKNIQTPEGASGLLGALDRDHDGSILNDLTGFLSGSAQSSNASSLNGAGILNHVLGNSQGNIIETIAKMSGLDSSKSGQILTMLAPILMGALGKIKQAQPQQQTAGGGLLDLITKTQQSHNQQSQAGGIFEKLLDKDGDGQVMDDLLSMGAKSLLGGLFK
jgi:hypothetical protein